MAPRPWQPGLRGRSRGGSHPCTGSGLLKPGSHGDTGTCSYQLCPHSRHGYRRLGSPDTHSVLREGREYGAPQSPHPTVCCEPSHVAVGEPDRLPILAAVPGKCFTSHFTLTTPVNRCSQHPHPKVQPRREFPGSPQLITPRFHCSGARV